MMQDTSTPPPEVQRPTARPPAGAGANRWDRQRLLENPHLFHQFMAQAHFKREAADPMPTPTRTRQRKPDFVKQVKRANAAGLQVKSVSVTTDCVVMTFAEPKIRPCRWTLIETAEELRKLI